MKNIMIGAIGGIVMIYMVLIQLSVYAGNIRENELENSLSESCMQTLKNYYGGNDADAEHDVTGRIKERLSSDSEVTVAVLVCDMTKGILSVRVDETFRYPNGSTRTVTGKKTAIMERKAADTTLLSVRYLDNGSCYKAYELLPGEIIPVPKLPEHASGWKIQGQDSMLDAGAKKAETDLTIEAVY